MDLANRGIAKIISDFREIRGTNAFHKETHRREEEQRLQPGPGHGTMGYHGNSASEPAEIST